MWLLAGTVPAFKKLLAGTLPAFKRLLAGTHKFLFCFVFNTFYQNIFFTLSNPFGLTLRLFLLFWKIPVFLQKIHADLQKVHATLRKLGQGTCRST